MKLRSVMLYCLLLTSGKGAELPVPSIEWQRSFGGSQEDLLYAVQETQDGGFILAGSSYSPADGNRTATNYGGMDYWTVRLDSHGNWLWDRCLGGTSFDHLSSLTLDANGGFIVGGGSTSGISGNKTSPHFGTEASDDYWIVHFNGMGIKTWEQGFGGTYSDVANGVRQTSDGGFIVGGYSASPISGNKTATNFGSIDFWLLRLDNAGIRLWDKSFGGDRTDLLWDVYVTEEGGFVLAGGSGSAVGGNKTSPNRGIADFWVVRLDTNGDKLWDRSFGGTNDDTAYCVAQMPDGGFVVGGRSSSPPAGNKTSPNFGEQDFWVVRLNPDGDKIWEQSYGGPENEQLYSLAVTRDGGVILGGWSSSPVSGNKTTTNYGRADFWVIRLDSDGNKLWEATFGGSRSDELQSIQQTSDGGYVLGGWSNSPVDGNKSAPSFSSFPDFWVIKLAPEQPRLQAGPWTNDSFRVDLHGIKNLTYSIDWSTNLTNWTLLQTQQLSGSHAEIWDRIVTNSMQRFYRARVMY